jgi:hypothetical protein
MTTIEQIHAERLLERRACSDARFLAPLGALRRARRNGAAPFEPTMQQQAAMVPFAVAAHPLYFEGPWADVSLTPGANVQQILQGSQVNVPQYGFLKALWIWQTSSGGVTGTNAPAFTADAPPNILAPGLKLVAPNAAELHGGANWGGFEEYTANKHQALYRLNDPQGFASWSSSTVGSPSMALRLGIEVNVETGLGALPNLDAQAPFQLYSFLNNQANIWTTLLGTIPVLRFRHYIEAWTVPDPTSALTGAPQERTPPGISQGIGLLNYWALIGPTSIPIAGGAVTVPLIRKGNILRTVIMVIRRADTNARIATAANYPSPLSWNWDGAPIAVEEPQHRLDRTQATATPGNIAAAAGVGSVFNPTGALDAGVFPWKFADPGGVDVQAQSQGQGLQKFVQTTQSSRIEFVGTWPAPTGGAGANVQILLNDIALVQVQRTAPNAFSFGGPIGTLMNPAQREVLR